MNNSTFRIVLTVAISLGILLIWQHFFAPRPQPSQAPTASKPVAKKKTAKVQPAEQAASRPTSQPASRPAGAGPVSIGVEGKHQTLEWKGGDSTISFTDQGGTLRHVILTNKRYKEFRRGKLRQVDIVQTERGKGPWPLVARFGESDFEVPVQPRFSVVSQDKTHVEFSWKSAKVRITKRYELDPKMPVVRLLVKVENLSNTKLNERLEMALFARQDPAQAVPGMTNPYPRVPTGLCRVNGEIQRRSVGAISGTQSQCSAAGCGTGSGPVSQIGLVDWVGSDDRYFLTALIPEEKGVQRRCGVKQVEGRPDVVEISLLFPEKKIKPGKSVEHRFLVFLGAKELSALDAVQTRDKRELGLSESIEFGWFALLCRPMLALLKFFYSFLGNWGLAIILLTVVVKGLTFYWTHKSMKSMRAMQKLKPKMDALREKYGEDKSRLNQEMMALYKVHGVNPLGGCLPMVLQMPVWFALYRTLGNAQELYRSEFVAWISDLTAPDQYFVLPIAMGASMFAQQLITPQPLEGTQAKMMKYFMPGMFTFMMLWLPAGLTLYIFVNTLLSMAHQWHMNRSDPMPTAEQVAKDKIEIMAKGQPHPKRQRKATASSAPVEDERSRGGKSGRRRRRKK